MHSSLVNPNTEACSPLKGEWPTTANDGKRKPLLRAAHYLSKHALTPTARLAAFARTALLACALLLQAPLIAVAAPWGTYLNPFSAQSPWNAQPVQPVLGDYEIPKSSYFPHVADGIYSTGVFLASAADAPVDVFPLPGRKGVWDPDTEVFLAKIAIPRWPADVVPASGGDGHADIVDPINGIVHSFFQLKFVEGRWVAAQYAWTRLDGRGWGDPAHYFQGARAAGVPTMAGIIRKHELNDGEPIFRHALALSMTFNGLSPAPPYIFPATGADRTAPQTNTGKIPEGALLMLPKSFDTTGIKNVTLRKIAETFKVYGGYAVDRNVGTPYLIYVENGSNFKLHEGGWNNATAADLDRIRAALRQVVSTSGWLDGDGRPMEMDQRLNLLSMRGFWNRVRGSKVGTFDTWKQAVVFEATGEPVVQSNVSGRNFHPISWALPVVGQKYRLTAIATGGAQLRLQVIGTPQAPLYDSGDLDNGKSVVFNWPSGHTGTIVTIRNGGGSQPATVRGTLIAE